MGLFDGKVVVVTGAGGGIGKEHALSFTREGASVVVNDLGVARDGTASGTPMAESVAAEIRSSGGNAVANTNSVSESDGAEAIIQTAIKAFGRLDVLVNNAGILRDKTILKMTDEQWDIVQAVHLRGTFLCLRAACHCFVEQGSGGAIINTSSTSGLLGNFGQANYGAAKAGIAGLTRTAALEMAKHGIRVNVVVPVAKTRMTEDIEAVSDDLGPEWIPPLVLFLASDLSKGITGRIFAAEGGIVREYFYETTLGMERNDRPWTPQEIADNWKDVVKKRGGVEVGEDELEALVVKGIPAAVDPAKAAGWNACIHLELLDGAGYTLKFINGRCSTQRGLEGKATCVLTTDQETAYGVLRGELDGTQAYMRGKLKVSNISDIVAFTNAYDPAQAREGQNSEALPPRFEQELTPRGLNTASINARFRGKATFVKMEKNNTQTDSLSTGSDLLAPLLNQALPGISEVDVLQNLALQRICIDICSAIQNNDLVFPFLKITNIESGKKADKLALEGILRREGEIVQRHTMVGWLANQTATSDRAPLSDADFEVTIQSSSDLRSDSATNFVSQPVSLLYSLVNEILERNRGDNLRLRTLEASFHPTVSVENLILRVSTAICNDQKELLFEAREPENNVLKISGHLLFSLT
jgi:NAD(P)-dependent dehydrogenase (short-subunit alcohol dehydrogenase family)/putative sterol carrier protein